MSDSPGVVAEPEFDLSPLGCLALLWPAIPEALLPKKGRAWIEEAVALLPPIPRIGLELPLGESEQSADLHQLISRDTADALILKRYLGRYQEGPLAGVALRDFLIEWANSGDLQGEVNNLYLEWDHPSEAGEQNAPAVFLPVEDGRDEPEVRERKRAQASNRVGRLQPGDHGAVLASLASLLEQLPAGIIVNYIGLMTGRGGALRVNLRSIARGELGRLLQAISWPGDKEAARSHFDMLVDMADRVIVALDLAPDLQASIGFEIVMDAPPSAETRWRALFDHLADLDLCTPQKRAALEEFSACLFPEREREWPAAWLLAAILSVPRFVPWVEQAISHLKVTMSGDGVLKAKAYVSAQHFWSRPETTQEPCAPCPARTSPPRHFAGARQRAVAFLLADRRQDGMWRDFRLAGTSSDEWVTGFAGYALLAARPRNVANLLQPSVKALLRRRRPRGSWGFSGAIPPDSDSTAWVLRFLKAAGCRGPALMESRAFLLDHRLADGGFASYAPATGLGLENRDPEAGYAGWRQGHLCVAAPAAIVLDGVLNDLLLSAQSSDGRWTAYWWEKDIYTTALALEALADAPEAQHHRTLSLGWARTQLSGKHSAFDRAWLIQLLLRGNEEDRAAATELLEALIAEQLADGSWPKGAGLLVPDPALLLREEKPETFLDHRRVFTTASVLMAIAAVEKELA